MKKYEWKDITTYSRGEQGKTDPRIWEIRTEDGLAVRVHRILGADGWFVSCSALDTLQIQLKSTTSELAKKEGLQLLYGRVLRLKAHFEDMIVQQATVT